MPSKRGFTGPYQRAKRKKSLESTDSPDLVDQQVRMQTHRAQMTEDEQNIRRNSEQISTLRRRNLQYRQDCQAEAVQPPSQK
jgi:hypothetical protein